MADSALNLDQVMKFPQPQPGTIPSFNVCSVKSVQFKAFILVLYGFVLVLYLAAQRSYLFFSAFTFTSHLNHFGWNTWTCSGSNICQMRRNSSSILFHSSGSLGPSTQKKQKSGVSQVGSLTQCFVFAFTISQFLPTGDRNSSYRVNYQI